MLTEHTSRRVRFVGSKIYNQIAGLRWQSVMEVGSQSGKPFPISPFFLGRGGDSSLLLKPGNDELWKLIHHLAQTWHLFIHHLRQFFLFDDVRDDMMMTC